MQADVLTRGRVPVAVIACFDIDALSVCTVALAVLLAVSVALSFCPHFLKYRHAAGMACGDSYV